MDDLKETFTSALDNVWGKLSGWLEALITMLPNLLVAVAVVLGFYWAARGVRALLINALSRVSDNSQVVRLIATTARVAVLVAGLFVALGILNLDKTVTSLLAGVGILGLALGFAFQDLAQNFISGIIMSVRHELHTGDLVEVDGVFGRVEGVDLRATRIMKPTGQLVTIPNRKVLDNAIVNYTLRGERRVDVEVGIAYDDDIAGAIRATNEALSQLEGRAEGHEVEVFATGFGGSSIDLVGRFWIPEIRQAGFLAAQSEAIVAIKRAFDDAGITIPFPIRTLDFDPEVLGQLAPRLAQVEEDHPGGPSANAQ